MNGLWPLTSGRKHWLDRILAMAAPSTSAAVEQLPDYALKYAPIVWLHTDDAFFPGDPIEHITHTHPQTFKGENVEVPENLRGKVEMLALPQVNKPDVFLTMNADVRENPRIPELLSRDGKPDINDKSKSPCYILTCRKDDICRVPDTLDVFYFFFYPYNLGNKVLFQHFGNHVGDWEHAMIRFVKGVPQYMHLSAHADGNAWAWSLFEKEGDRPVIYSAGGSHAMYPTHGKHNYSGVFLVGPQDYTSKGYKWDPTKNFVTAKFGAWKFKPLTSSAPGHNKKYSEATILTALNFEGRWGNSFSELRKSKPSKLKQFGQKIMNKLTDTTAEELQKAEEAAVKGEGAAVVEQAKKEGVESLSLHQKLLLLIYAEGPTGPRDKALERPNMNRWDNRAILEAF